MMDMARVSLWGERMFFILLPYCPDFIFTHTEAVGWGWMRISRLLLQDVVVEGVVAGHGDEGAETNANGVKDLSCSIHPHLQHITISYCSTNSDIWLNKSLTDCAGQVRQTQYIYLLPLPGVSLLSYLH